MVIATTEKYFKYVSSYMSYNVNVIKTLIFRKGIKADLLILEYELYSDEEIINISKTYNTPIWLILKENDKKMISLSNHVSYIFKAPLDVEELNSMLKRALNKYIYNMNKE
jgi:hypothetical protein